MCTVLLPPGVNPIAVNKYIKISNIFVIIELWFTKDYYNHHFVLNYYASLYS
jgi:hypothetical protein